AIEILREQFKKVQLKRADNATEEGRVFIAVNGDASEAAMVEIQCESAPVATGDVLKAFGDGLANWLLNGPGASSPEELMSQTPTGAAQSFQAQYEEIVNKIREKIVVNRVARVKGPLGSYVHHDFKTGVVFQATGDGSNKDVLRDVAMHIAALRPTYATEASVDSALVAAEREKLTAEAKASGKPDNIVDKIVDGRMKTFYVEQGVLTHQPFAKDDSKTVEKALAEAGFAVAGFLSWRVGSAG
ncbi:MAG: translation elongation factor Ts, partial [Planctomycetaceae bacterium]|nr:translation elongation factor Ts [Planctomycetaceae bacterium]